MPTAAELLPYCVGILFIALTLVLYKMNIFRSKQPAKAYPADTVILHDLCRGPRCPSVSPFPLKLETYLRMAKIPYQNEFGLKKSSKGKIPWITYNGEDVADSQFCIEYLKEKHGHDFNSHLTPEQKAVARAFAKMSEENLAWAVSLQRWVYSKDYSFQKSVLKAPFFVYPRIRATVDNASKGHGIGRHTEEEVLGIARGDMLALSVFLGDKPFLMGDEPCEADCAVFGVLAQMKWHLSGSPYEIMVKEEFKNLDRYCDRMKDKFWPDWNDCITGGSQEAKSEPKSEASIK